jgi:hypothetical protein
VDGGRGAAAPAGTTPAGKTELRVVLVGRAQADDIPAHFTCRFDKATEEAASKLKPDQTVRLTGAISTVTAAADRIDMTNCHDLGEAAPLSVGDQLAGLWRCSEVTVDGAALRKASQARGIKVDDIPDATYTAAWHIDLLLKSDGSLAAELLDNAGASLKKLSGRCQVQKDSTSEARLRMDVSGTASQEVPASIESGRLVVSLPGLADKFVLPGTRFAKVEGVPRPVDHRALKVEADQWFNANIANINNPTLPKFVSDTVDQAAVSHQNFFFTVGGGALRRGRMAIVFGAFGRFMPLECSDAETQFNANTRTTVSNSFLANWGTPTIPEIKIEAINVDNRNNYDPAKPLTGKITLRSLRRTIDAPYLLGLSSLSGNQLIPIDKPGPDPQIYDFRINPQTAIRPNPRPVLFFIGRQSKPGDLFADNPNCVISEPVAVLLDLVPSP